MPEDRFGVHVDRPRDNKDETRTPTVLVVHDDADFLLAAVTALKAAGYSAKGFTGPDTALPALPPDEAVDVLISRIVFSRGLQTGISCARILQASWPRMRVLFTALPDTRKFTGGLGEFLPLPIAIPDLLAAVAWLVRTAE